MLTVKKNFKNFFYLFSIFIFFVSCQSNPISGRNQLFIVSESMAINSSKEAYSGLIKNLKEEEKLNVDKKEFKRLVSITEKLVFQAVKYRDESKNWNWNINLIDNDEVVNAWCMAGGKMAMYSGLIKQLNATDDEIAQVMAHEIAHALLSHTREKISRGLALQASMAVMAIKLDDTKYKGLALQGISLATILALELPNSRSAETESDALGIEIAAKAGFNPKAAVSLWKKMSKLKDKETNEFFSTHPSSENRISKLQNLIPAANKFYMDASIIRGSFKVNK